MTPTGAEDDGESPPMAYPWASTELGWSDETLGFDPHIDLMICLY